ncbi:MAG: cytochrome c3 family protein [Desulfurivibrionaceae bacterium]
MNRCSGILSRRPGPATVLSATLLLLGVFAFLGHRAWLDSSAECVRCHGDQARLIRLGAPWAYVTEEAMRKESRHPYILCRDCHLGNGRARDKELAHRGMLKMLLVGDDGNLLPRASHYPYGLSRTGPERIYGLLPKKEENGEWLFYPVRNLLWHDRNPESLNFDPKLAAKTCGKPGCHPEELRQFLTTTMGTNRRQRTMKSWLEPYGPHNCGPSFADLPPAEVLRGAGFSHDNTAKVAGEMNLPFSRSQAEVKQKLCNVCHTGCLDCHYQPGDGKGVHNLVKQPAAESCAGFGRSTSMCHSGAMQSRRGGTYLGGDYAIPAGMKADRHHEKGLACTVCHLTGEKGMGDMERKAECRDCHLAAEEALAKSVHRKLSCAACHVGELGGYQITVWGPGLVGEEKNPFHKYLYYGMQKPPLLMKDRKGIWQPMKLWPNSVGNIKAEVEAGKGFLFRWPKGETADGYAVLGTVNIGAGDRHLFWLEAEQASHPYGQARDCASCHQQEEQVVVSRWEFADDQGGEPFAGGWRITADHRGLRLAGLKSDGPIRVQPGFTLADFAPWVSFAPVWQVPGDFAIRADQAKYRRELAAFAGVKKRFALLAGQKSEEERQRRPYRDLRDRALHDPVNEPEGKKP